MILGWNFLWNKIINYCCLYRNNYKFGNNFNNVIFFRIFFFCLIDGWELIKGGCIIDKFLRWGEICSGFNILGVSGEYIVRKLVRFRERIIGEFRYSIYRVCGCGSRGFWKFVILRDFVFEISRCFYRICGIGSF